MMKSKIYLLPYVIAIPIAIVATVLTIWSGKTAKTTEASVEATAPAAVAPAVEVTAVAEATPAVEVTTVQEMPAEELASEFATNVTNDEMPAETTASQWHFYNSDLQDNGDAKDDYNFGTNPLTSDEFSAKVMEEIRAKNYKGNINIDELFKNVDASGLDKEFRKRLRQDPALGAADMAWFDSILGTRYLGEFYSEAKEQWDAAMNNAKERWMSDPETYTKTLDAFEKYLDSATKVEVRRATGLTDQMYMNPHTVGEIPDIVVMESADHSGWFLVYTFTIKETAVKEIMYRLDCGYQPTNVAKVMNVKPKSNPTKAGGKSAGGKSGGGQAAKITGGGAKTTVVTGGGIIPGPLPTPTPKPTPAPSPTPVPNPKDPTKGTPVLPNDDPGPGPNTNTGKGGQYSSEDQPGSSNDLTPAEYKEKIDEISNNPGQESGDSTPSTPPPSSDTKEDNNGAEADKPTETSDSSVANDNPGESWDGPPD